MFVNKSVEKLLKEWKKESRNNHLSMYKTDGNTLIIYTDRPGCMIGAYGKLVGTYQDKIVEASFGMIKNIKFVETYGIF